MLVLAAKRAKAALSSGAAVELGPLPKPKPPAVPIGLLIDFVADSSRASEAMCVIDCPCTDSTSIAAASIFFPLEHNSNLEYLIL